MVQCKSRTKKRVASENEEVYTINTTDMVHSTSIGVIFKRSFKDTLLKETQTFEVY